MSKAVVEQLQQHFRDAVLETHDFRGDDTVVVQRERIVDICRWLKTTPACDLNMMMDLCGVDYPGRAERFEVVYHLYSTTKHHRVRLKVRVPEADPVVDSIADVWVAANWFERECFDLFGIHFRGHPNLKRLLTFDEFVGHPLRKDYPVDRRPPIPTPDPMQGTLAGDVSHMVGGVGDTRGLQGMSVERAYVRAGNVPFDDPNP